MKQRDLSVQEAIDEAGDMAKGCIDTIDNCRANLPSWGEIIDRQVNRFFEAVQYCIAVFIFAKYVSPFRLDLD